MADFPRESDNARSVPDQSHAEGQPESSTKTKESTTTMKKFPSPENKPKDDADSSCSSALSHCSSSAHTVLRTDSNNGSSTHSSSASKTSSAAGAAVVVRLPNGCTAVHFPAKDFIYKVPGPLPDNHPSKRAGKRHHRLCSPCVRRIACMLSLMFIVALFLVIALLLFYIFAQPRLPRIHIESVAVSNFNVTDSLSSTRPSSRYSVYVSTAAAMKLRLQNRSNKMRVRYEGFKGVLLYEGTMISQGAMDPLIFHQSARNITAAQILMRADMVGLAGNEAESMKESFKDNTAVRLQVGASVTVFLEFGSWDSGPVPLDVNCSIQGGDVGNGMTSALIPEGCQIYNHKWPLLLLLNPFK
ncbi:hypothetical protein KP509_29G073800 [Ceratopteris richardii]|uniref:Late embryogenesis abundant protein LEA-2 subgroup domain-containing protein n=1 Tax=Ceratopteris richardii TaxID=49495 RepID=A0A8T2R849_CERRI|nr:hypothetical protein KP509_29G073800 [Ceratopteris richardii]